MTAAVARKQQLPTSESKTRRKTIMMASPTRRWNGGGLALCILIVLLLLSSQQSMVVQAFGVTTPRGDSGIRANVHHPDNDYATRFHSMTTVTQLGSAATNRPATSRHAATTQTEYYTALLDGPCWRSLQKALAPVTSRNHGNNNNPASSTTTTTVGQLQLVTGTLEDDNQDVIGILASYPSDNDEDTVRLTTGDAVVAHSVASIPSHIAPAQAASTYAFGLTHVHSLLTVVDGNQVGRGDNNDDNDDSLSSTTTTMSVIPPTHAVVVGGNPDALLAAQGLQAMGCPRVTLVSTQNPSLPSTATSNIDVTSPEMTNPHPPQNDDDDDEVGFAQALGSFDALLDTVGNEMDDDASGFLEGSVIRLLRQEHACTQYMTTYTKSQELINKEGVLFGPGKVNKYQKSLVSPNTPPSVQRQPVPAPLQIGQTIQTLLEANVIWNTHKNQHAMQPNQPHVRGWDMGRFLEQTLWPLDSRGAGTVRYGFPVPGSNGKDNSFGLGNNDNDDDEDDDDDGVMISKAPMTRGGGRFVERQTSDNDDDEDDRPVITTPYIRNIIGYRGLQQLENQELTAVLFLSAKWCRTCKRMQLPFRRMAKQGSMPKDDDDDESVTDDNDLPEIVFCKGEASGRDGKMLGRALGIETVPTFVLFRKGKRYGEPLSISRLPSKKLQVAIQYLQEGREWDDDLFADEGGDTDSNKKEKEPLE
uniref:Thioredoxin domain-containing protein n=1 Tax=Entomoneis paludosa TaxID=265537 RepID=A0A7S3DXG8_9STRA